MNNLIIGIAGGSGSGKTTPCTAAEGALWGGRGAADLHDSYYKAPRRAAL